MRRLFLHVGTYKTATTTLQALCAAHRGWLLQRGFIYPQLRLQRTEGSSINHRLLAERLLARTKSDAFRELPAYWQAEVLPQLEAQPAKDVLLSAEALSRLPLRPDRTREDALKRCLSSFDVRVILYLRRQDQWYEAVHNQDVKAGAETRTLQEYVTDGIAEGRADHAKQLRYWAGLFGEPNLIVRVFEPAQLQHGDIVKDFLQQLGIVDLAGLREIAPRNPRLSPELLELKRALVNRHLKEHRQRKAAQRSFQFVQRMLPHAKGRTMPYALACDIMRRHAAGNELVARRFLARESGVLFESAPEQEARWEQLRMAAVGALVRGLGAIAHAVKDS